MKIYTKQGDSGETGLYGGARVSKDHLRISCYGTLDELNSLLGWTICSLSLRLQAQKQLAHSIEPRLLRIQGELFQLGAELATPRGKEVKSKLVDARETSLLESEIDEMEGQLAPLKTFILPGGSELSCRVHLARSVCRRAERELITLHRAEPVRQEVLAYLNRLSDYFFVTARFANHLAQIADVPWLPE